MVDLEFWRPMLTERNENVAYEKMTCLTGIRTHNRRSKGKNANYSAVLLSN